MLTSRNRWRCRGISRNAAGLGSRARHVHNDGKIVHACLQMRRLDQGIGIEKACRLADEDHHDAVGGGNEGVELSDAPRARPRSAPRSRHAARPPCGLPGNVLFCRCLASEQPTATRNELHPEGRIAQHILHACTALERVRDIVFRVRSDEDVHLPCQSASSRTVRRPWRAMVRPRFTAMLVLPTPPLPLAIAIELAISVIIPAVGENRNIHRAAFS